MSAAFFISSVVTLSSPKTWALMNVISFSMDQIKMDGWLRWPLTQAASCVRQLSNSAWRGTVLPPTFSRDAVKACRALAVEDARAADRHAVRVKEVQSVRHFLPAVDALAPDALHGLAVFVPQGNGFVIRPPVIRQIRAPVPGNAVERELRSCPAPFAEAELGRALVYRLPVDAQGRDDVVLRRASPATRAWDRPSLRTA